MKKSSVVLLMMLSISCWSCRNHAAPQKSDANGIGAKIISTNRYLQHS